jgi:general secretion pathway protein I
MSNGRVKSEAGFSLVEALVALFLFGVASVGLIQLQSQSLAVLSGTEDRALAQLVAQNQLVMAQASRIAPGVGEVSGQTVLAGRTWTWTQTVSPTEDPRSLQIAVRVRAQDESLAAEAFAFMPAALGAP